MQNLKSLLVLSLITFFSVINFVNSADGDYFKDLDSKTYRPQEMGLKDLFVEIRVTGLKDLLIAEGRFGKIKDVWFELYWALPDKAFLDIKGLPEGFEERKSELITMVSPQINFLIPAKMSPLFAGYQFSAIKKDGKTAWRGKDSTGSLPVTEFIVELNSNGVLDRFETLSVQGKQVAVLSYRKSPWTNDKWQLERTVMDNFSGYYKTTTDSIAEMKAQGGFGLPEKITVTTRTENTANLSDKKQAIEGKTEYIFSKYAVNTAKAEKFFMKRQ